MSYSPYLYLKCTACGWCHVATPAGLPARERCFRCEGGAFIEVAESEVPRGVTVQALRWPAPL
jgi:hypothetical protein